MRVVVIGATGNIGTALLRRLSGDPDARVVGVARRRPPDTPPYDSVEAWHEIDIAEPTSAELLRDAMTGADAVVHLAWGFQPSRDPAYLRRIGVDGSARVLDAAAASGVGHLVHTSSVGAYAPKIDNRPVDENYATSGITTSMYSRHKVLAERHLDFYERTEPNGVQITRIRPGFVLQPDAGAALTRYGLPAYLPTQLITHLPLLPLDAKLIIPVVHSSDVADAITRILDQRATGPFNLAADRPLNRDDIARLIGAHPVNLPSKVLRATVSATWHAHLQPLDAGWIDLAFAVPLMDTSRARSVLGWRPVVAADAALAVTVKAMSGGRGIDGSVLRPQSMFDEVQRLLREGPRGRRRLT
ncbi:MAG: NAD-dependent epimerase/dehydratase family protein [bacterium]